MLEEVLDPVITEKVYNQRDAFRNVIDLPFQQDSAPLHQNCTTLAQQQISTEVDRKERVKRVTS